MRKGHDGLAALVRQCGGELFSGHLFVFLSRRADRVKILCWDRGGFMLWYKRLERGRFKWPRIENGARSLELDAGQLAMLLEGVDYTRVRRGLRWQPPSSERQTIDNGERA
jgi:transposase